MTYGCYSEYSLGNLYYHILNVKKNMHLLHLWWNVDHSLWLNMNSCLYGQSHFEGGLFPDIKVRMALGFPCAVCIANWSLIRKIIVIWADMSTYPAGRGLPMHFWESCCTFSGYFQENQKFCSVWWCHLEVQSTCWGYLGQKSIVKLASNHRILLPTLASTPWCLWHDDTTSGLSHHVGGHTSSFTGSSSKSSFGWQP